MTKARALQTVLIVGLATLFVACRPMAGPGGGCRQVGALRVVSAGHAASAPRNPRLHVQFVGASEDGKSGHFRVSYQDKTLEGWAREGETFAHFAQDIVGRSGVTLVRMTASRATLLFQWSEPS
jgi:hypothetical protein